MVNGTIRLNSAPLSWTWGLPELGNNQIIYDICFAQNSVKCYFGLQQYLRALKVIRVVNDLVIPVQIVAHCVTLLTHNFKPMLFKPK